MKNDRDILEHLGANLKTLRLSKGLQQKEVANMIGISAAQYGRIENGTTNPSVVIIAGLAKVFNVGMDLLIFGERTQADKEPIVLKDKELVEKMKHLDKLNEEDKEVAHQLLDLILAKKRFKELMKGLG